MSGRGPRDWPKRSPCFDRSPSSPDSACCVFGDDYRAPRVWRHTPLNAPWWSSLTTTTGSPGKYRARRWRTGCHRTSEPRSRRAVMPQRWPRATNETSGLIPGGTGIRLSADRAAAVLRTVAPTNAVDTERKRMALGFVADIRRLDTEIAESKARIVTAVAASGTSVTELYGVGPVVAAFLIGHSGDMARFANRDHYASYNATAPIEASSGPRVRHRLNPRGNRRLNHAIHVIAICQIRHPGEGRKYFDRKVAEGKTTKEALRALKRQISNAVYRQLVIDSSS